MGLDAHVPCRCWEEGLCHPPPELAPYIRFDPATAKAEQMAREGGWDLLSDIAFDRWVRREACAHENMRIASERIANWPGVRSFQHALWSLDAEAFDTLLREIPGGNGGSTNPENAARCLVELDRFRAAGPFGQFVELIDAATDETIHTRVVPCDGWLGANGTTGVWRRLTEDGRFEILRLEAGTTQRDAPSELLFSSASFGQIKLSKTAFRLTDEETGRDFIDTEGVRPWSGGRDPARLAVRVGSDHPDRSACVDALVTVFQAAVDTGHPVHWT